MRHLQHPCRSRSKALLSTLMVTSASPIMPGSVSLGSAYQKPRLEYEAPVFARAVDLYHNLPQGSDFDCLIRDKKGARSVETLNRSLELAKRGRRAVFRAAFKRNAV